MILAYSDYIPRPKITIPRRANTGQGPKNTGASVIVLSPSSKKTPPMVVLTPTVVKSLSPPAIIAVINKVSPKASKPLSPKLKSVVKAMEHPNFKKKYNKKCMDLTKAELCELLEYYASTATELKKAATAISNTVIKSVTNTVASVAQVASSSVAPRDSTGGKYKLFMKSTSRGRVCESFSKDELFKICTSLGIAHGPKDTKELLCKALEKAGYRGAAI